MQANQNKLSLREPWNSDDQGKWGKTSDQDDWTVKAEERQPWCLFQCLICSHSVHLFTRSNLFCLLGLWLVMENTVLSNEKIFVKSLVSRIGTVKRDNFNSVFGRKFAFKGIQIWLLLREAYAVLTQLKVTLCFHWLQHKRHGAWNAKLSHQAFQSFRSFATY